HSPLFLILPTHPTSTLFPYTTLFRSSPERSAATVFAESSTLPVAVAVRAPTPLPETSTMRAAPDASRWVNPEGWPVSPGCGVSVIMGPFCARTGRPGTIFRTASSTTVRYDRRRSGQQQSLHDRPGRQFGDVLGHDHQRVGVGQCGELVRILPCHRAHSAFCPTIVCGPSQHTAQVGATARRCGDRRGEPRPHRRERPRRQA